MSGKSRGIIGKSVIMYENPNSLLLPHPPHPLSLSLPLSHAHRIAMGRICSRFKELFVEIRERASKALFFAKMLSKVRLRHSKEKKISSVVNFVLMKLCYVMLIGLRDCC